MVNIDNSIRVTSYSVGATLQVAKSSKRRLCLFTESEWMRSFARTSARLSVSMHWCHTGTYLATTATVRRYYISISAL